MEDSWRCDEALVRNGLKMGANKDDEEVRASASTSASASVEARGPMSYDTDNCYQSHRS